VNNKKTKFIKLISFVAFVLIYLTQIQSVSAQGTSVSPYSQFGLGELNSGSFGINTAMANTGIAYADYAHINLLNPASYSDFSLTVFEAGARLNRNFLTQNEATATAGNTGFGYVAIGFPLKKWWGAAFGILPYSGVNYSFSQTTLLAGETRPVTFQYIGRGGYNRAFIGNSFKIYDKLKFGFNTSFLFGAIDRESSVIYDVTVVPFNSRIRNKEFVSSFTGDAGLQYKHKITEEKYLSFGAVYGLGNDLNAQQSITSFTYIQRVNAITVKDTILNIVDEKGKISLPSKYGFGLSFYKKNNYLISLDYTQHNWSNFSKFDRAYDYKNSNRIALGGQYTPDFTALRKPLKTSTYRFGLHYEQTFLEINDNPINDIGISLGFAYPVFKSRSTMNVSVTFGQRGTTNNNLIQENYILANFGMIINDKWFIKKKYD
jgi:long-subunit fatty acid transport protein